MSKRFAFVVALVAVCMSFVACASSESGGACGSSPTAPTCTGGGGIVGTFDPVPTPEVRFVRDSDGSQDPWVSYSLAEEPTPPRGSLWQPMLPPVFKIRIKMGNPGGNNPLLSVSFSATPSIDGVSPMEFSLGGTGTILPGEDKVVQVGGVYYVPYAFNWVLLKGSYRLNDGPPGSGGTLYNLTGRFKVGYHT